MIIRKATEKDYFCLAEMKWQHCLEDDEDYGENNLKNVDKDDFIEKFIDFLTAHKEYKIWVAQVYDKIVSAMFVYMIPKTPKPNGNSKYIAYLTNVFTAKEFRNQKIGTKLLEHIKKVLAEEKCELIFVFPSENSVRFYERNGFSPENEIFECDLN